VLSKEAANFLFSDLQDGMLSKEPGLPPQQHGGLPGGGLGVSPLGPPTPGSIRARPSCLTSGVVAAAAACCCCLYLDTDSGAYATRDVQPILYSASHFYTALYFLKGQWGLCSFQCARWHFSPQ
jgi:hypothetical protein